MNAFIVNNEEGDIIAKPSTVSRKRLFDETKLDVRRENPVQNKVLRTARYFKRSHRKVYRNKIHKLKKKWKPCYICADPGHGGNFCPQVNTCSVCSKEESKNNVEEDHTSIFCLKCGSTGHGMFSCTNGYDPEDLKGIQCYICLDFGHLCCTENSNEGPSEASCYNCGQSGHHGFECTKMNAVANKLQPVSICFKCQKGVHSRETSAKTINLGKDEVMDKSMKEKSLKAHVFSNVQSFTSQFLFSSSKCISDEFEPSQTGELDNKSTLAETTTLEKEALPDKSIKRTPQKTHTREFDNDSTSSKVYTVGKYFMLNNTVKGYSQKAQIVELDNKSTSAETTLVEKEAVLNKFVKKKSPNTQVCI